MRKNKNENLNTLKWLSKVIGKNKLNIVMLLLIQVVLGICSVYYAVLLRNSIDEAIARDIEGFKFWIILSVILIAFQILLRGIYRYLEEYSKANIENLLKKRLLENLFYGDYAKVSSTHSGEWMNRITSDTVIVTDGLVQILPGITGMGVKMMGALFLIIYYLPGFGALLIMGGFLMLLITCGFRKILKKLHKNIQETDGEFRSFTQENLVSLIVVKAFTKEGAITDITTKKMEMHKKARMKKNHFSNFCNISFATAMNTAYIVGLVISGYGIIKGTITYGVLMAILQLIGQIQSPFANITSYLPKYYSMLASAERIIEVEEQVSEKDIQLASRKETKNGVLNIDKVMQIYNDGYVGIAIEKLNFAYSNEAEKIFHNYSFRINKGECIAICGESGCGKSTLLKLLMHMYEPKEESIYLELNYGKETYILNEFYRSFFAYVPQGNFLMSGTIRDIVSFYDEKKVINDEEIYKALHIACADGFVKELPDELDTVLGEHGVGISEGQMQRIAIARAIYAGNPILLLDEATSALDENTEARVLKNLRKLTDKTVLIVTHRPAALEICDRVVRM